MTYDELEQSREQGAPIMVATFALGQKLWRFARGDEDVEWNGHTFLAPVGGIEPSRIQDSTETRKNDVSLVVDRSFPIAELWRISPPTAICSVVLQEIHEGAEGGVTAWLGHVSNVSWEGEARATITLSPGALAMATNGLRRLWQKSCSHVLYGPKCRLSRWGEGFDAELVDVDGAELTAFAFGEADDLVGGRITWQAEDGITRAAMIVDHDGESVRIWYPEPTLATGLELRAFPRLHQVLAELQTVDGLTLVADEFDNGMKFNGGFIEWTDEEGVTDYRAVVSHVGNTIKLLNAAPRLEAGVLVIAVEGCDRTIARCDELDNSPNFGGVPYFIHKNPFGSHPIF